MRTHIRAGFTLIELMVAMALTLFIMVILSQAFVLSLEVFAGMKGLGDMQINLRTATSILRDDLSQDHFEGKRRLSDLGPGGFSTFVGQAPLIAPQPVQAGFFSVLQSTTVSNAVGAPYFSEGTDSNTLPSYRASNHVLYLTVKRRGNRPENFFTVPSIPAAFFTQNTAYDVSPTNLAYDTLATPNSGFYSSQWAEVIYFLVRTGSTEEPNNQTSNIGTPTFELYRAQWVMVPDGTNVSGTQKGNLATTTFQGMSCAKNAAGTLDFYSPMDASLIVAGQTPTVKRVEFQPVFPVATKQATLQAFNALTNQRLNLNWNNPAIPFAGQPAVTALLPNVISFQIQVMPTPTQAVPNPPFQDIPATGVKGTLGHFYDTSMFAAPAAAGYTNTFGIKAIQITLRVWDNKTRQTRQITIVQDL